MLKSQILTITFPTSYNYLKFIDEEYFLFLLLYNKPPSKLWHLKEWWYISSYNSVACLGSVQQFFCSIWWWLGHTYGCTPEGFIHISGVSNGMAEINGSRTASISSRVIGLLAWGPRAPGQWRQTLPKLLRSNPDLVQHPFWHVLLI